MSQIDELTEGPGFRPMLLDSRHLRLIVAIVDAGGLTRASERMNVTQSALSHQLKQLESAFGVPLFVRLRKRLILTEAGREILEAARDIVGSISVLEERLRQRAAGWRGTLRIATECYTCYQWLPPLLKRFARKHPNVDVTIEPSATDNPQDALLGGTIDLAIVTRGTEKRGIAYEPLFRDELLLLVPPDHTLAAKSFVTPSDLAKERLLLYTPPSDNAFYRQFFRRAIERPDVTVVKLTEAVLAMVRAGLGVTVAARWAVAHELSLGSLVAVRLGADGFHREWLAATLDSGGRPAVKYIDDFVTLLATAATPSRFVAAAR